MRYNPRSIQILLAVLLAGILLPSDLNRLCAQESNNTSPPKSAGGSKESTEDRGDDRAQLKNNIERLKSLTDQVLRKSGEDRARFNTQFRQQTPSQPSDTQGDVESLINEQQVHDQKSTEQIEQLRQKLNQMMSRQALRDLEKQKKAVDQPPSNQPTEQTPKGELPDGLTGDRNVIEKPGPMVDSGGSPDAENAAKNVSFESTPILARPVDRLALADSLFQSEEFQLASDLYRQLSNHEEMKPHKLWLEYQLAACSRKLGDLEQARVHLRNVTESQLEEFPVPQARWWLEQLDKREMFEASSMELDRIVELLKKELKKNE